MSYYPLFMDLAGRRCLVVGTGAVAARKARALLACGALVTAVGPDPVPAFRALERRGLTLRRRRFRSTDVGSQALVIGATDDPKVNTAVWSACRRRNIPVNVVDVPERCTFIVPAVVRRGGVTIAISTGGKSPAAARLIRERVEAAVGKEHGDLVALLGSFRSRMLREVPGQRARAAAWRKILGAGVLEDLRRGDRRGAACTVKRCLEEAGAQARGGVRGKR
jgi:siroheme synthase-like protein